jgi:DNA-binding beta-propeller fold protein YncE
MDTKPPLKKQKRVYHPEEDTEDVIVEVTMGAGTTQKFSLPPTASVLTVKQGMDREKGIAPRDAHLFVHDDSREDELKDGETLRSLRQGQGLKVSMTILVEKADAQAVIPGLKTEPDVVIEGSEAGSEPGGVAFVPDHPNWIVTAEYSAHKIEINDVRTGALVCKFGGYGDGYEGFQCPHGVAVALDSRPTEEREIVYEASTGCPDYHSVAFVFVADYMNSRVQMLQIVAERGASRWHLDFVRSLGFGFGDFDGGLDTPVGVALLPGEEGSQESVLITEDQNHRVSQFKLDGTFVRIFVDGCNDWDHSGDGNLLSPRGITVLRLSGEVAVADVYNHRVHIFDSKGNHKQHFGTKGKEVDGELSYPTSLASDVHGNVMVTDSTARLQVFSPEGKHLCTRKGLVQEGASEKGIAWSPDGGLAITSGEYNNTRVWGTA